MSIYIRGAGVISIQESFGKKGIENPIDYHETRVSCIEPDFKEFFSPIALRRMSRIIKRSVATALNAIKESGIEKPDAIISGSGLGCIGDTEKFLISMIDNEEQFLQPTHFIQSTHNTISSQIALHTKNHAYNNTYSHKGISFESALMDAILLFRLGKIHSALVGGFDEMTPLYFIQLGKVGFWKDQLENTLAIHKDKTPGSFSGEGSVSLMLSDEKSDNDYAEIVNASSLYRPSSKEEIRLFILDFLQKNQMQPSDIDLLLTGLSGDVETDIYYEDIAENIFPETTHACYKNLCGEYFTASSFGLWNAACCIKNNSIHPVQIVDGVSPRKIKNVLLYNQYKHKNHSLILLR